MKHPYSDAPTYRRWRAGVADIPAGALDPVVRFPWKIGAGEKIAAAGSCFAQHVARHLRQRGYSFIDEEPAHPILPVDTAKAYGYGQYSARYGNVYTSRQLLQLLRRAYGHWIPKEDVWMQDGRYYDPFRPGIQPAGFPTRQEYELDRQQHYAAVRRMFEGLDVFVFTLGLTECWTSREDGAAYPLCPGTVAGEYDPARHGLFEMEVQDVEADLCAFAEELRAVNPGARIIVTVSPVPLAATALDQHVLVSSTASKAILRIAAARFARQPGVAYFPSYEIVTAPSNGPGYFASDLRSIREEGVRHVMDMFFRHVFDDQGQPIAIAEPSAPENQFTHAMQEVVDAICEESRLDGAPWPGA